MINRRKILEEIQTIHEENPSVKLDKLHSLINKALPLGCYDCGLEYGSDAWIEAIVPDKIWNRIKPEGCEDGGGILCISCISERIVKLKNEHGIREAQKIPVFLCGTEPLEAFHGDSGNYIDILRTWDIYDREKDRENYLK